MKSEAESNGSSQLKDTGACAYRFVTAWFLAELANGLFNASLIITAIYNGTKTGKRTSSGSQKYLCAKVHQ